MSRNVMLLTVTEDLLAALLTGRPPGHTMVVSPGLPEGFQLVRVLPQRIDGSFQLLVAHPSFPEVPPGQLPPSLGIGVSIYESAAPPEAPAVVDSSSDRPGVGR